MFETGREIFKQYTRPAWEWFCKTYNIPFIVSNKKVVNKTHFNKWTWPACNIETKYIWLLDSDTLPNPYMGNFVEDWFLNKTSDLRPELEKDTPFFSARRNRASFPYYEKYQKHLKHFNHTRFKFDECYQGGLIIMQNNAHSRALANTMIQTTHNPEIINEDITASLILQNHNIQINYLPERYNFVEINDNIYPENKAFLEMAYIWHFSGGTQNKSKLSQVFDMVKHAYV